MNVEVAQTRIQEIEQEMSTLRHERNALSLLADPAIVRDEVRAQMPEAASVIIQFIVDRDGTDYYPYLDNFQVFDKNGKQLYVDDSDVTGVETKFFAQEDEVLMMALDRLRKSLDHWQMRIDLDALRVEWV